MGEIDFSRFEAVTFDCYGTLIDWEQGILNALQPVLAPHGIDAGEDELLERYARHEAELEAGTYLPYRDVLAGSLRGLCAELGVSPSDEDARGFALAIGDWPAFHDTAPALRLLHERFRLGVITNCDRDLFALSNRRLGVTFDWIVTAEDARAYKPSHAPFELAFETIDVPRDRILHAAQSLFHDHVPAGQLGLTSVWVDRRHDRDRARRHARGSGDPGPDGSGPADARRRRARLVRRLTTFDRKPLRHRPRSGPPRSGAWRHLNSRPRSGRPYPSSAATTTDNRFRVKHSARPHYEPHPGSRPPLPRDSITISIRRPDESTCSRASSRAPAALPAAIASRIARCWRSFFA